MRKLNKLNAQRVKSLLSCSDSSDTPRPRRYGDGGYLYLSISADRSRRRWVFLYRWKPAGISGTGKLKELGLGSATTIDLKRAREKAAELRGYLDRGLDPKEARKPAAKMPTFGEVADTFIESKTPSWRNPKSAAQWQMTLSVYCGAIRDIPVDQITVEHVLSVLQPIWLKKPETAQRLRGRIENVLDSAHQRKFRSSENPARYRESLKHLLPIPKKLTRGNHKALAKDEIPSFYARLEMLDSVSAICLKYLILTAARSGEAIGAKWDEIDLGAKTWTVPAARMKAGREHSVPLSEQACAILRKMEKLRKSEFVFPGDKPERPLSGMSLTMVMRRLKVDATVHGFRSSFRDWAAENGVDFHMAETALAHTVRNSTTAAYLRTQLINERRPMMKAWAEYCAPLEALAQRSKKRRLSLNAAA